MGIKKLSWKKIVGIVVTFLFVLSSIITIVKGWDVVLGWLIYLGNLILEILKFSFGTIGRDVLLFILIVSILILINKKLKKLSVVKEEKVNVALEKEQLEEDEEILIHRWILTFIGNARSDVAHEYMYSEFKKEFPLKTDKDFLSYLNELLELGFIRRPGTFRGDFLYSITPAGSSYRKKISDKAREKKS